MRVSCTCQTPQTYLGLRQEEIIVLQSQSIKDVEFHLQSRTETVQSLTAIATDCENADLVGKDESIIDEQDEPLLELLALLSGLPVPHRD